MSDSLEDDFHFTPFPENRVFLSVRGKIWEYGKGSEREPATNVKMLITLSEILDAFNKDIDKPRKDLEKKLEEIVKKPTDKISSNDVSRGICHPRSHIRMCM